ncbi:hypothetical protein U9M48_003985 [Paspalum notatum var. saurae]|uniref:Uncharacterized protein n=1 Tax=Paspalum notatum var. saurae TaxID=547442 RepID=A0AAQ3PKC0_PASNO
MALGEETPLSDQEHLGKASFVLKILKTPEENIQKELVRSTKMHIKQLKTCQESKMELTGQNGQVGQPNPRSADQGQAEPDSARSAHQGGWSPDPMNRSADPWFRPPSHPSEPVATSLTQFTKKHKGTQIQPQHQASNVSKGRKCTKSRIHNVNNPREEQNDQGRADTWSPDILQCRPTYPLKHFPRATTVLTTNRHGDARSSRWSAKAVDRVVGRPRGTKMHIKQLKTCQGSKMGLTGQNGQAKSANRGLVARPND